MEFFLSLKLNLFSLQMFNQILSSLVNKKTLKVEKEIKVGSWPYQVALNKKNNLIYVTNQRDNSISVTDLNQKKVVNSLMDVW